MRKLSNWAHYHSAWARIIIIALHIILCCLAFLLAKQLFLRNVYLSSVVIAAFILLFFAAVLCYPGKVRGIKKSARQYVLQKSCDFVIGLCSFGLVACISNQVLSDKSPLSFSLQAAVVVETPLFKNPEAKSILDAYQQGHTDLSRKEKKILKQEFKYQVGQYVKAKLSGNSERAGSAGLIILTIVLAIGLVFALSALVCTISCNGSEAAAIIVAILGSAAIIFGLIMAIRAIKRRKAKGT